MLWCFKNKKQTLKRKEAQPMMKKEVTVFHKKNPKRKGAQPPMKTKTLVFHKQETHP
jgi:hypothetical protein